MKMLATSLLLGTYLPFFFLLSFFPHQVHTLTPSPSKNSTTIYDLLPALTPLLVPPPPHQSFTQCCLKAINATYTLNTTTHLLSGPHTIPGFGLGVDKSLPFINLTPEELLQGQFPCGARYDGPRGDGGTTGNEGAPQVTVSYGWCRNNCGGWGVSNTRDLGMWVQPFVGFILPSTVFCLNVPRRSVLAVFDGLFHNHFENLPKSWGEFTTALRALLFTLQSFLFLLLSFFPKFKLKQKSHHPSNDEENQSQSNPPSATAPNHPKNHERNREYGGKIIKTFIVLISYILTASFFMLLRGMVAATISLLNTLFWMAVVFSTAGPMMLSGLYEARLDRRVVSGMLKALTTVQEGGKGNEKLRFYRRVGGLYGILVGNLEFGREKSGNDVAMGRERVNGMKGKEERTDSGMCVESEVVEFATVKGREIAGGIVERSVWDDIHTLVRPEDLIEAEEAEAQAKSRGRTLPKDFVEHLRKLQVNYRKTTETRLKAMLDCQGSFGAVIGAAVVFFVGSFLFSVVQNLTAIGDNDTSHALAFGMWWMIVPHVAIVSGCLLAGNNPNTLEVIMCSVREPWNRQESSGKGWWRSWWRRYYSSVYVPVRMVERGPNKRLWLRRLVREYPLPKLEASYPHNGGEEEDELDIELDVWDWIIMSLIVVFLMGAPFVLAYLTSFYTPAVGMSCRAFTILLYFLFQVCYMAIWGWDFYTMRPTMLWRTTSEKQAQKTNRDIERNRRRSSTISSSHRPSKLNQLSSLIHKLLLGFVILGSTFTSVFGTCFQLIGLYRNCLCYMPMKYWRSGDFAFGVSSNTADDILWAKRVWLPTGVTSIVLMIVTCYIGWWYQRHWRVQFREVVRLLLDPSVIEDRGVDNNGKEDKEIRETTSPLSDGHTS